MVFDPRTIATPVYEALSELRSQYNQDNTRLREQKSQAVELYNYIATWGLLRLKAEEVALSQDSKKKMVNCFFQTLAEVAFPDNKNSEQQKKRNDIAKTGNIDFLTNSQMETSEYLGLTALALQVAREFAFWAEAVYPEVNDIKNNPANQTNNKDNTTHELE